jgi:hypothetical protein
MPRSLVQTALSLELRAAELEAAAAELRLDAAALRVRAEGPPYPAIEALRDPAFRQKADGPSSRAPANR